MYIKKSHHQSVYLFTNRRRVSLQVVSNAGRGLQPRPKRLMCTVIQKICVRYV